MAFRKLALATGRDGQCKVAGLDSPLSGTSGDISTLSLSILVAIEISESVSPTFLRWTYQAIERLL